MTKTKKHKIKKGPVSLLKLVPNIITLIGLCIGLGAIRFALDEKWENAVLCTIVAACIDGVDGKIARLLNASSIFGAELDSLSDFINFGITPVLVTYLWIYDDYGIKVVSWSAVMMFTICTALRLARFNTMTMSDKENKIMNNYFVGVPAPIAAILALIPLINEFDLKYLTGFSFRAHSLFIAFYQFGLAILLASKIPTYSIKNVSIEPKNLLILFIALTVSTIALFLYTWLIIPIFAIIYLITIMHSYNSYYKITKNLNGNSN